MNEGREWRNEQKRRKVWKGRRNGQKRSFSVCIVCSGKNVSEGLEQKKNLCEEQNKMEKKGENEHLLEIFGDFPCFDSVNSTRSDEEHIVNETDQETWVFDTTL